MQVKKVFVLGMARSGYEAAKLLAKDHEVLVVDGKEQIKEHVEELQSLGVTVKIGEDPVVLLDGSFDLMVKNPGIHSSHPAVSKALELHIPVINEVELAYHYLNSKAHVIGITGSNGKTTTTTLISLFLQEDGRKVFTGGNIGIPFSQFVLDVQDGDFVVLEISDHQLCDMNDFKTEVSVLTNLYPVHLDFHGSFLKYQEIKKRIFSHHTKENLAILNKDNNESVLLTQDILSTKMYFSKQVEEDCFIKEGAIYYHEEKIIDLKDILLQGNHNYENIMAAILAVKKYDVKTSSIQKVLKTFQGVPHRIEFVRTLKGRSFYNDSKATNCESTKIALRSFQKPTLLLLGGLDRGHSFDDLTPELKNVKYVACYGETKNKITEYCKRQGIACDIFLNLEEATKACYQKSQEGDVILLSPACASWDQFDSFEQRGDAFKKIVNSLGE